MSPLTRSAMAALLLSCGPSGLSPPTSLLPVPNEVLPQSAFLERYGSPCRMEPLGVGERWLYCVKECPCNEDQAEGGLILCSPGCTERAAYAWSGGVSWEP